MCRAALIMPRFSAVSFTVTVWCRRRRPRPRTDAAIAASWPYALRSCVTFSFPLLALMCSTQDVFEALAALGRDAVRRGNAGQRIDGRAPHVDRVARAVALGKHVA